MNNICIHHNDAERRQTGNPCPVCQKLEIDQLRNWKDSAMFIEREWDGQALAKLLGARLGESTRKVIMKRVPEILAELEAANQDAERLAKALIETQQFLSGKWYDNVVIKENTSKALAAHEIRIKKP